MNDSLAEKAASGDIRAAAKLMRIADDRENGYEKYMEKIWANTGNAYIIGITGAPGAGKSTLTDALITHYRKLDLTVGVVAIDPSSPFSGGAILGDRIRMSSHNIDNGVFIRSLGTRGHLGGLSASAMDIAAVMDAMGKDIVIIETVGVGQDEIEITSVADTCIVVTLPGMGDDIQAIKAGIFEIADIFVVNKADREGSEKAVKDLETMIEYSINRAWKTPVIKTVAIKNHGINHLAEQVEKHRVFLSSNKNKKFKARLVHITKSLIKEKLFKSVFPEDDLESALEEKRLNPYIAANYLWSKKF